MAKMGRPKSEKPRDIKISVRFTQEEYECLLEYAQRHKMSVTQVMRLCLKKEIFKTQL